MNPFAEFTTGDWVFIVVVTVGTSLIVYFANRGRRREERKRHD